MIQPFIILSSALVGLGAVLYAHHRLSARHNSRATDTNALSDTEQSDAQNAEDNHPHHPDSRDECCGMHAVCERTLAVATADKIVYFDDEELDMFRGRPAHLYQPHETDMFRQVLLTLVPEDISPWAESLQRRGIIMPDDLRDEYLMLYAEAAGSVKAAS